MRIGYIVAMAGLLACSPAMAQVVITAPNNGAAAVHEDRADQARDAGHQNMDAARANAAVGNYSAAAQDQAAAHQDMHAAHQEEQRGARGSPDTLKSWGGVLGSPGSPPFTPVWSDRRWVRATITNATRYYAAVFILKQQHRTGCRATA
jgi:hypothetical protein